MDEQELIRRVQTGDEWAFGQIMALYKDRIVNYLYQFTGDYQKAVELAQETFIRVYFKADRYKPIAPCPPGSTPSPRTWPRPSAAGRGRWPPSPSRTFPTTSRAAPITRPGRPRPRPEPPRGPGCAPSRYRVPVVLKDMEGFSRRRSPRSSTGPSARSKPASAGAGNSSGSSSKRPARTAPTGPTKR